jgi:carbon-monoxide dehydrogenase iron sulfur subunit
MFKIHRSRCTECQLCSQICAWTHWGENNPKRARIRVEADWPATPQIRVCLACKEHECVQACPTEALSWDGWVKLDEERCDLCGACAAACPVDGIRMDPRRRLPLICDTCEGAFQCVQWCPTRAIEKLGV